MIRNRLRSSLLLTLCVLLVGCNGQTSSGGASQVQVQSNFGIHTPPEQQGGTFAITTVQRNEATE